MRSELLTILSAVRVAWAPWRGFAYSLTDEAQELGDRLLAVQVQTSGPSFTVALDSIRIERRKNSATLYILNTATTGRKTRKGAFCKLHSAGVATLAAAGVAIMERS